MAKIRFDENTLNRFNKQMDASCKEMAIRLGKDSMTYYSYEKGYGGQKENVMTFLDTKDIAYIFDVQRNTAIKIMNLLVQHGRAMKNGRSYTISGEDFEAFYNENKGMEWDI